MTSEPDPWWAVLVGFLESFAHVSGRQPNGLIVRAQRSDGTPLVVEIVMNQREWDDVVSLSWGVVEPAAQHVRELVLDQPRDKRYLVYGLYHLVPCDSPGLPVNPDFARVREIAAEHPDGIPGAGWYAWIPIRRRRSKSSRPCRDLRTGTCL